MPFHAFLVIRDEADILPEVLTHLLTWADSLHILDTGSTDDSWAIVHDFASRDARVKPFLSQPVVFLDALRAPMIHAAKPRPGDWIARVDADEFFPTPPPQFIRDHLSPRETFLLAQMFDFVLRPADLAAWRTGTQSLADRSQPIALRRQYAIINRFPEQRLWKYRRGMRWPLSLPHPVDPGPVARARIPIRHYRWRDPPQAQLRWALRRTMRPYMLRSGGHWSGRHWLDRLRPDNDPDLLHLPPDRPLPEIADTSHLALPRPLLRHRLAARLTPALSADRALIPLPPEFNTDLARRLAQWPEPWADLAAG